MLFRNCIWIVFPEFSKVSIIFEQLYQRVLVHDRLMEDFSSISRSNAFVSFLCLYVRFNESDIFLKRCQLDFQKFLFTLSLVFKSFHFNVRSIFVLFQIEEKLIVRDS